MIIIAKDGSLINFDNITHIYKSDVEHNHPKGYGHGTIIVGWDIWARGTDRGTHYKLFSHRSGDPVVSELKCEHLIHYIHVGATEGLKFVDLRTPPVINYGLDWAQEAIFDVLNGRSDVESIEGFLWFLKTHKKQIDGLISVVEKTAAVRDGTWELGDDEEGFKNTLAILKGTTRSDVLNSAPSDEDDESKD